MGNPKRQFVVQWGVNGVKKYTSKQHAVKFACGLLQQNYPVVAIYAFWDYEAHLWSLEDRSVEKFVCNITNQDRLDYLMGIKADLFA
jgi:hypothetical protein